MPKSSEDVPEMLQKVLAAVEANSRMLQQINGTSTETFSTDGAGTQNRQVVTRGVFRTVSAAVLKFFAQASTHGELTVQTDMVSDENIFLLESVKYVSKVQIVYEGESNTMANTIENLDTDDVVFVHPAAATCELKALCSARGVKVVVAKGDAVFDADVIGPASVKTIAGVVKNPCTKQLIPDLPAAFESSADPADVDDLNAFPWRICLAGGWLDQPWVSSVFPGSVIVVNIKPHPMFKVRSGLATSTRQAGIKLWGRGLKPPKDTPPLLLARMLFGAENPPGVQYISGSQDALGLMLPGVNRLDYEGGFWPAKVTGLRTLEPAKWLEKVLWLVPLASRPPGYDPISVKNITPENVKLLADASSRAWDAICAQDAAELGAALLDTMKAWKAILPNTIPPAWREWCRPYDNSHGYLFSGAGGGFLMVISDTPVDNAFQVSVNTIPWAEQPFKS